MRSAREDFSGTELAILPLAGFSWWPRSAIPATASLTHAHRDSFLRPRPGGGGRRGITRAISLPVSGALPEPEESVEETAVPSKDRAKVHHRWSWEFDAPASKLWEAVSDTEKFNREVRAFLKGTS